MSVDLIPTSSYAEAQLLGESTLSCKCRKNAQRSRSGRDISKALSLKSEPLVIDLGPLLSKENINESNPASVFINCGSVPVEDRRYWDVTVINSDRARKGQQYKNIRIEESSNTEGKAHSSLHAVFRVLVHPRNMNVLSAIEGADSTRPGQRPFTDNKKLTFRVLFTPQLPHIVYAKTFLLWVDHVPVKLDLRGYSIGPEVCLSKNIINFGGVYSGNMGKRILQLHNQSLAAARFQFQTDNIRSTFKICPPSGTIQPLSSIKVEVTFQPSAPRSFYKRIYCLVHHHEPLIVDCLGICVPRPRFLPAPISFWAKIDPELVMPTPLDTFEDFIEGECRWGIKLESPRIDFGYRDPDGSYPDRTSGMTIQALSRVPYETLLEWAPDASKVFNVFPPSLTLPPNGSQTFTVNFKPNFPGAFYAATLECYIYPNSEGWEQNKPPWSFVFPSPESSPDGSVTASASKSKKKAARSKKGLTRPKSARSKNIKAAISEIKAADSEAGDGERERLSILEPPSEHGYQMRVKISRENEEQDNEFFVTPVADKINLYDLPDPFLLDEEINHQSHSTSPLTANPVKDMEECNPLPTKFMADNEAKKAAVETTLSNEGNVSGIVGGESSSLGYDFEGSNLSVNASEGLVSGGVATDQPEDATGIQHIHPFNILASGNDQSSGIKDFLDGPKRVALPLCLTLRATGHTFTPQRVPYIPNVQFPIRATMYACTPDCPVGRTMVIKNLSDLPCYYDTDKLDALEAFRVRPNHGLIAGNQHEIIVLRMIPKLNHSKVYKEDLSVTFNLQDNCLFGLYGYCEAPYLGIRVLCESESTGNEIACPITIAGCVTYTFMELKNPTGFNYRYWIEPADVEEEEWMIIAPQPSQGFIAPNETTTICWNFAPRADGMFYLFWRFCFEVTRSCKPNEEAIGRYEFIVPISGVAKTSYLKAEPNLLDFDMIQIFDTKSKVTYVRNDGECPVNAHFIVHHEQWLANFPPEMVNITPSRLSLKPHESAPITVTVRPSKTSLQHFYIIYNLEFKEDVEFVHGATMDVFEKHLVDISFMGDHTVFKFTDILMDSPKCIWDAQHCWSMFSLSLLNQLLTPQHYVIPEGSVPTVSSVSFRFPSAPINSSPYVFKLHLGNVSDLKGFWAICTAPPKGWKRYVHQKLKNMPETSEFKDGYFTDPPELATQLWVKKFGGNVPESQAVCNKSKDLCLFEITPKTGCLKSKESQVITMKYSFTHLGVHEASVLLRIFPAIYVWLDLTGTTLDTNQPYLQLMNKRSMQLHPVCLSDMDPPVQMFWIFNGGNTTASFSVDLEPFEKLKDDNFGHAVIECLTPKGGVPPKSWSAIKIRFSPLEYTNYSAPLIIYPNYDKTPSRVIIHGNAEIIPTISLRPAAGVETLRKHVLFSQVVPVTLSPSHVVVHHLIPTGQCVTRIVFLTNLHAKNTMKFSWEDMPIVGGGMITFLPKRGRLAPKEETACKVIINAGDTTAVLSTMITCTIEDETANVSYEFAINQWNDNSLMARETKRSSNEQVGHKPEKPELYNRLLAVSLYIGNVFGQYDNLTAREKSRMGFVTSFCCDTIEADKLSLAPFTARGSQFCKSIISDMIWDLIHSSNFASFLRQATKRNAPLFEEYVAEDDSLALEPEEKHLPLPVTAAILEQSIFNLLNEMAERYSRPTTRQRWHEIPFSLSDDEGQSDK